MRAAVIFSGAGISAPSGIPTFRGQSGLYTNNYIMKLVDSFYRKMDKSIREQAIARYYFRAVFISQKMPNEYHVEIPKMLLQKASELYIYTQNVDDLHEAGLMRAFNVSRHQLNRDPRWSLWHIHGRVFYRRSLVKNQGDFSRWRDNNLKPRYNTNFLVGRVMNEIASRINPTHLENYVRNPPRNLPKVLRSFVPQGINPNDVFKYRPDTVLFGEPVRYPRIPKFDEVILVIIGTSGLVYPAARIPQDVVSNSNTARVIEIGERAFDHLQGCNSVAKYYHIDYRNRTLSEIINELKDILDSIP